MAIVTFKRAAGSRSWRTRSGKVAEGGRGCDRAGHRAAYAFREARFPRIDSYINFRGALVIELRVQNLVYSDKPLNCGHLSTLVHEFAK